ncbi:hypothetical protein PV326_001989 [Microctonus aethiopoides]|nr:hypothetical protein PV326_001989 [Microctonus aethiopoides]
MDSSMEPRPSSAAEKSQGKKKESLVCPGTSNTLGPCIGAMHKQLCDIATVHACIPIVYALCSIVYYVQKVKVSSLLQRKQNCIMTHYQKTGMIAKRKAAAIVA